MFENNSEINKSIEKFTRRIIYDTYTGKLRDAECLNNFKRMDLAKEFVSAYFDEDRLSAEGYDSIGGAANLSDFTEYVAKAIDRLIPRLYFMESNHKLSERYTSLLTNRIWNTYGKDGFDCTKDLKYFYDHDFTIEKNSVKDTAATPKQLDYLAKLAKQNGYQLNNIEYMSKPHAAGLIEYFSGNSDIEPVNFDFFTVMV